MVRPAAANGSQFEGAYAMTLVLIIVLVVILLTGLRIAQEYERGVVFRLA
jgi:regulator of protease activity HflC (stomatin/prohibitin superfamily)